jgi:hypothetical protein
MVGQERELAVKRATEKDPSKLLELGARLAVAKRSLTIDGCDAFRRREVELQHEAKPWQLVADKDQRLIRFALMPVFRDNITALPATGWSTLRERPKLGEPALRCLFERGAIEPQTTREDIDRLRSVQKSCNVAPRHVGDWKRRGRR